MECGDYSGKLFIELLDGRNLPASRTYARSVRAVLA